MFALPTRNQFMKSIDCLKPCCVAVGMVDADTYVWVQISFQQ
jgi:hypothetical protein